MLLTFTQFRIIVNSFSDGRGGVGEQGCRFGKVSWMWGTGWDQIGLPHVVAAYLTNCCCLG